MRLFPLALAGALFLAACSSTGEKPETELSFLTSTIKARLAARKQAGGQPVNPLKQLTRAQLAKVRTRLMIANLEKTHAWAALSLSARNRGYETYFAVDRKSVTLKDGILTETRGLAGDMMESGISGIAAALRGGPRTYSRSYAWLNGEDHLRRESYDCKVTPVASETIEIVQSRYQTRHMREICSGNDRQFTNDYWLSGREIMKSRQWAGRDIGYVGFWLVVP